MLLNLVAIRFDYHTLARGMLGQMPPGCQPRPVRWPNSLT
jgi:hypothetical protein